MMVSALKRIPGRSVLKKRPLRDYTLMTVGVLLVALGLDMFLIPNQLAAGGVSGLATIIFYVAEDAGVYLPVGVQMLVMNAFLLLIGLRAQGWRYAAKTVYGIITLSVAIDLLAPVVPHLAADDPLLAALYGGAIVGLGLALVFRGGGNTGGTDIIAQLLSTRVPLGIGQLMLIVDAGVTLLAAFVFGPELALYGAVAIFVQGAVIDLVLEGLRLEKAAFIISERPGEIAEAVLFDLGRGATALAARGAYSGEEREMIFTVVTRTQVATLKRIVAAVDPHAMLIISDVHEAFGEGFREMGV